MKNYLGNLIARHMSQAEVLLPRLSSRFEPQSSVLQSDEFQGETAEMDVAETFGGESDVVAPASEPISVVPRSESDFLAPVSPIPSEIEHRVANPSPRSSRSPENAVESSSPSLASAELPTLTIAADDDSGSSILAGPTFAVANDRRYESTVTQAASDRVASSSRVQNDDDSGSANRNVALADFPTPSASNVATDRSWTNTTDQFAVPDHVAERAPKESGPTTQPFTANEPVTTDRPLIANEPLTAIEPLIANEHVTEIERVTPALRVAQAKPNHALTQHHIETQPPTRKLPTDTRETGRETIARVTSSEPFGTATTSEFFTPSVSHSEGESNVGLPKSLPQSSPTRTERSSTEHSSIERSSTEHLSTERSSTEHSSIERSSTERSSTERSSTERSPIERSPRELLSAVAIPERTEIPTVVNAASESQAAPKQPETLPEEARPPRRARQLETSVARSPVNDPRSVINPGNTRLMPHNDITPAEASPTINVTIGRIEVRAATSEPRPQKQRREQQVLSLDEYLNQRSAGGR